jgi:hypothetical protein
MHKNLTVVAWWFSGVSTRFLILLCVVDGVGGGGSAKMPLLHKQTNKQVFKAVA